MNGMYQQQAAFQNIYGHQHLGGSPSLSVHNPVSFGLFATKFLLGVATGLIFAPVIYVVLLMAVVCYHLIK